MLSIMTKQSGRTQVTKMAGGPVTEKRTRKGTLPSGAKYEANSYKYGSLGTSTDSKATKKVPGGKVVTTREGGKKHYNSTYETKKKLGARVTRWTESGDGISTKNKTHVKLPKVGESFTSNGMRTRTPKKAKK